MFIYGASSTKRGMSPAEKCLEIFRVFCIGLCIGTLGATDLGKNERVTVCPHSTYTIVCSGADEVIIILQATFGRNNSATCRQDDIEDTLCPMSNAITYVAKLCHKTKRCSVSINEQLETSTRCYNTESYLDVEYICTQDSSVHDICKSNLPRLSEDWGYLTSKNYPVILESESLCKVTIVSNRSDATSLQIVFHDMDLKECFAPNACCKDSVRVYDNALLDSGDLCMNEQATYTGSPSGITVVFTSGIWKGRRGFLMEYKVLSHFGSITTSLPLDRSGDIASLYISHKALIHLVGALVGGTFIVIITVTCILLTLKRKRRNSRTSELIDTIPDRKQAIDNLYELPGTKVSEAKTAQPKTHKGDASLGNRSLSPGLSTVSDPSADSSDAVSIATNLSIESHLRDSKLVSYVDGSLVELNNTITST